MWVQLTVLLSRGCLIGSSVIAVLEYLCVRVIVAKVLVRVGGDFGVSRLVWGFGGWVAVGVRVEVDVFDVCRQFV